MGNRNIKSNLRNVFTLLNISAKPIDENDEKFWNQIWLEDASIVSDVIKGISTQEVRMLRDGSPRNFALLTYKAAEKLYLATGTLCNTSNQQNTILNATRILTRLIPCVFEDKHWRAFFDNNHIRDNDGLQTNELIYPKKSNCEVNFKAYIPTGVARLSSSSETDENPSTNTSKTDEDSLKSSELDLNLNKKSKCLSICLVLSISDLLFCPEFTVPPHKSGLLYSSVEAPPEDLRSISSCDYVWEPGVGFDSSINSTTYHDKSRADLLQLLLATFSSTLYDPPQNSINKQNIWIEAFSSSQNRHTLPLFTSLLNTVFIYNPSKLIPFNHLLFNDPREELVELALQVLLAVLDYDLHESKPFRPQDDKRNLFIEYMSRIHRGEDFTFIIKGFTRLLNNRLEQGYLPNSSKHINFDQELLILFWRIANLNSRFINHLLRTTEVLDIAVPILYHLNENYRDATKTALIHVGVFNLLVLSSERNFGVRLNKPYAANVLLNLRSFTGSHADLLIIVFHKLILYGQNINQLFDFMVTIIANVSPYLKAISMVASNCLIELFEVFSQPKVIFTELAYHQLVTFLLDIFNNLIQYQFDGNANLICAILVHKSAFLNAAKLPTSLQGIQKVLRHAMQERKMIEALIAEQSSCQATSDDSSVYPFRGEAAVGTSQAFLATVSFDHFSSSRRRNQQHTNEEVVLVDTPDLDHMTKLMHQFGGDDLSQRESSKLETGVETKNVKQSSATIDDLIGQTDELLRGITDTTMTARDATALDASGSVSESKKSKPKPRKPDKFSSREKESLEDQSSNSTPPSSASEKSWRPTPEWAKEWKKALPLNVILRMIEVLTPQLDRFKDDGSGKLDDLQVIKFLQNGTLVGLLPVPHPIIIRKYEMNDQTKLWFRTCTWGAIYVRSTIWTDTHVKLVRIHLRQP